jgi:anti-anti-sigma regulatory factor
MHMTHKSSHLPREIYHRIYWYAKRNVDPRVIAHTLRLPLKTVEHIVDRFSDAPTAAPPLHMHATGAGDEPAAGDGDDFLDIFLFVKTRYAVMDISGMVTKRNIHKLTAEFLKLRTSDLKAVALSMTDVRQLDGDGLAALIALSGDLKKMGRYSAVLDPSPAADAFIAEHDPGKKLQIFGTEIAFEAHAFR